MTFRDEHEGGCGASLTQTDFDAGYCTQCKRQLTTKETKTMSNNDELNNNEESSNDSERDSERCPDCGRTSEEGACFFCKMD